MEASTMKGDTAGSSKLMLALACTVACATAKPTSAALPPDTLQAQPLAVTEQNLTSFTVEARMEFQNPDATALTIREATFEITLDGTSVNKGRVTLDLQVAAGDSQFVRIPAPTTLAPDEETLKKWLAKGDTPIHMVMQGTLIMDEQGVSREAPYSEVGELRAPRLPKPKMNDVDVGRYGGESELGISFFLGLENQNPFEVRVASISYRATLDGKEVAAGMASTGDHIPASQTAEYEIETAMKTTEQKNEMTYSLEGVVDLGVTKLPYNLTGPVNFSKPGHHKKKGAEE
jgi:LEA14-like dessication related protein